MIKKMALRAKLLILFFGIGLTPFVILGGVTIYKVSDDYSNQVYRQLESLREIKKKQCEDLFKGYFKDISILAETDAVINALKALAGIVQSDAKATESEFYKAMAKTYAPSIDHFANTSGYLDLMLIAKNGDVVYTTAKKFELGLNLFKDPLRSSSLKRCFENALKKQFFVDFAPYEVDKNIPAAFIGAPVKKKETLIGSVVLRIALSSINDIMHRREGMGETGETYLVGSDYLMRSDSFRDPEQHSVLASFVNPETGSVDTPSSRKAISGETGQIVSQNYKHSTVLSSFAPVTIGDIRWGIIAEIETSEVFSAITSLKWILSAAGGVGVLFIFFVALLTARSIIGPIKQIIGHLTQSADNVSSAAEGISSSSQKLAKGSGNQVASLVETSSALEEMSATTKQNADHAGEADQLMKKANSMVGEAYGALDKLTISMQDITSASEKTSKIIKTIDEIAFQTNLLALNAAVEAARAGEAGAGFAVVADEVRNLAIRAAEAAKETAGMIEDTVKRIGDGTSLVDATNDAFYKVVERTSKVGGLVGEIAGASNEQAQGIEQINNAVAEMDQVTQQCAATAEESSSASDTMNSQAEELKGMVAKLVGLVEGIRGSQKSNESGRASVGKFKSVRRRLLNRPKHIPVELNGPENITPNIV